MMNEDFVTRLRDFAERLRETSLWIYAPEIRAAASEIDFLRESVQLLHEHHHAKNTAEFDKVYEETLYRG